MSEQLSDEELELLQKHRAEKARKAGRKVRIKGKHEDSGAEYEFELDGDEAERVISRHKGLWAEDEEDAGDGAEEGSKSNGSRSRSRSSGSSSDEGEAPRKAPAYFGRK